MQSKRWMLAAALVLCASAATAQAGPTFVGRHELRGEYSNGVATHVTLKVVADPAGNMSVTRTAGGLGSQEPSSTWSAPARRMGDRTLVVRYAVTTRTRGSLIGILNGDRGGQSVTHRFLGRYAFDGNGVLEEVVVNETGLAPHDGWTTVRTSSAQPGWKPVDDFLWGISSHPLPDGAVDQLVPRMNEGGFDSMRIEVAWKHAVDIETNPDNRMRKQCEELSRRGIRLIPILANGFAHWLPDGVGPGEIWDGVSQRRYIEQASQHVRSAVRFFRTLPGGVPYYQLENELNAAGLATLPPYEWRKGSAWSRPRFKDRLIAALAAAVRAEDPTAKVYTNFHDMLSDPPYALDRYLGRWSRHLDVVGLDFYPNYILPVLTGPHQLQGRVEAYRSASGLPVILAETAYPSSGYGHSEILQANYLREIVPIARRETVGMIYLHLEDRARTEQVPEGLPWWRFMDPMVRVEPNWGVLDRNYQPKSMEWLGETVVPWEVLKTAIRDAELRHRR